MIPNIDSKPTLKPFKDVSGIFGTANFDGGYLIWTKIPEIYLRNGACYNVFCLSNGSINYIADDSLVLDPKSVNMKVEF